MCHIFMSYTLFLIYCFIFTILHPPASKRIFFACMCTEQVLYRLCTYVEDRKQPALLSWYWSPVLTRVPRFSDKSFYLPSILSVICPFIYATGQLPQHTVNHSVKQTPSKDHQSIACIWPIHVNVWAKNLINFVFIDLQCCLFNSSHLLFLLKR